MGTTVHSREGREVREGRDDRGFAFAELREARRSWPLGPWPWLFLLIVSSRSGRSSGIPWLSRVPGQ